MCDSGNYTDYQDSGLGLAPKFFEQASIIRILGGGVRGYWVNCEEGSERIYSVRVGYSDNECLHLGLQIFGLDNGVATEAFSVVMCRRSPGRWNVSRLARAIL